MSEIKDKLAAIKKILFGEPAPVAPQKLDKEYKLEDGTPIMISDLNKGGAVMINNAPAPDGSYELEDGTMLSVAGGVITDILPAKEAAPAAPGAPPATDFSQKFTAIEGKFAEYEQKFAGYEKRIAQAEATINNQKAINQQLFEIVEKMADVPVADPIEPVKNNFSLHSKDSREDRIKNIGVNLKKIIADKHKTA